MDQISKGICITGIKKFLIFFTDFLISNFNNRKIPSGNHKSGEKKTNNYFPIMQNPLEFRSILLSLLLYDIIRILIENIYIIVLN